MAAGTVSRYKTGLRLATHRIPYALEGGDASQTEPRAASRRDTDTDRGTHVRPPPPPEERRGQRQRA